jgi:hypothetical protein
MLRPSRFRVLISCAALPLAGCHDEIASYRIPKEKASEPPPAPAHGGEAAPASALPQNATAAGPAIVAAGGDSLSWTAPAHWQPNAAQPMRKASWTVAADAPGRVEVAVTAFPGDVGGATANLNRWRAQLGLPALADGEASSALTRLDCNGLNISLADLTGAGPANAPRIVAAIVPISGATWFFKLTGPDSAVAAAKPAFLEFLRTVKPAAAATLTP